MEYVPTLQTGDLTSCMFIGIVCLVIYLSYFHKRVNIPGPVTFPLIGNFFTLVLGNRRNRLYSLQKRYGNIFRLYFGRRLVVTLCGKDLIHDAFIKQADSFSDRPDGMAVLKNETEKGIVWSNGHTWKVLRRFTLQSMRDFGLGKNILEERILDECNVVLGEIAQMKSKPFCIKGLYRNAVANITHIVIFGKRREYHDPEFQKVIDDITLLFNLSLGGLSPTVVWPFLKIFKKDESVTRMQCIQDISSYIKAQVDEHKVSFDETNIRDFVDAYLEAEKNGNYKDIITPRQLFKVILNLFNAGTDTTAASLDWAALYMISYPDIQDQCQQEIDKVVGQGRQVRMSDKSELPFVEATLLEIQRLANVAIASLPHMATRDAVVGGYTIPKGAIVIGHIQVTHEDPRYWDDPLVFKPSRFLDADNKVKKYDGFMPFSVGPRACPGESLAKTIMFLMFSNTLQRFNFRKREDEDVLSLEGELGLTKVPKSYELRLCPRT